MADILIPVQVSSLFNHTESASNQTEEDSHQNNKHNGHGFTKHSLIDDYSANFHKTKEMFQKLDEKTMSNSNSQQHYDSPVDASQQIKKPQRSENNTINYLSSNEKPTTRFVPLVLPSNVVKRMDHLNTIFVKPIKIEQSLPKLVFQDNDNQEQSKTNETPILNGK
jgi:hypothetical protein